MKENKTIPADRSGQKESEQDPIRSVRVLVDRRAIRQTITAFGGNFAIARFGDCDAHDSVGFHVLNSMPVGHARVGIPLKTFIKASGDNYDAGHVSVKDVFQLMETLRDRKIPLVASIWDVPDHCLVDPEAKTGRRIAPDKRDKVIAAIVEWLRLGRERHGLTVPYVSFDGPESGENLLLEPEEARYFITRGGAAIETAKFTTKWILGDTATAESLTPYVTAVMADKSAVPYLGPVAFHGWDSLSASDDTYRLVAKTARHYRKPVWCLEAGYRTQGEDVAEPAWESWEYALNLAVSYARCLTLAEASVVDYWQFQNERPLIGVPDAAEPAGEVRMFPAFHMLRLFAETFPADTQIVSAKVIGTDLYAVVGAEPEAGRLRVLLVNTGDRAEVLVTGGQPRAEYAIECLDQTQGNPENDRGNVSEMSVAVSKTDDSGSVVVTILPSSVTVLSGLA